MKINNREINKNFKVKSLKKEKVSSSFQVPSDTVEIGKPAGNKEFSPVDFNSLKSFSEVKEVKNDGTSKFQNISASLGGFIGHNGGTVFINESEHSVDITGSMGSSGISIQESKGDGYSSIMGSITGFDGFKSVNLQVSGEEGRRSIHGWVGGESIHLMESSFGEGRFSLMGQVGKKNASLHYTNIQGNMDLTGTLNDSYSWETHHVSLRGTQNPGDGEKVSYLGALAALTLTDR